ncbi:MAG: hypothetical protein M1828_000664 [Chrysothrix sp. TS-e1954]|nr:MAG: hypothetical protein M1828_000664 [Chrysothrix sp. TS-e1954]
MASSVVVSKTASAFCISTPGVNQQLLSACEALLPGVSQQLSTGTAGTAALGTQITLTGSGTATDVNGVPTSALSSSTTAPSITTSSTTGAGAVGGVGSSGTSLTSSSKATSATGEAGGTTGSSVSSQTIGSRSSQSGGASNTATAASSSASPTGADTKAGALGGATSSSNHSNYINHVVVPAVVVGVVAGLIILGLIIWLCLARRRRSKRRRDDELATTAATPEMSHAPVSHSRDPGFGTGALAGAGVGSGLGAGAAAAAAPKPHHESGSSGAPMIGALPYDRDSHSSPSSDPSPQRQPHELEHEGPSGRFDLGFAQHGALPTAETAAPAAGMIGVAHSNFDTTNRSSLTDSVYDDERPSAHIPVSRETGSNPAGPVNNNDAGMASGTWLAGMGTTESASANRSRATTSHGRTNSESSFDPFVTPSTGSRSSALNREELLRGGPWEDPSYNPHTSNEEERQMTPTQAPTTSSFYQQPTPPRRSSRRGPNEYLPPQEEASRFSFGFPTTQPSTTDESSPSFNNRASTRTVRADDYRRSASTTGGAIGDAPMIPPFEDFSSESAHRRSSSHTIPRKPIRPTSGPGTGPEEAAQALEGRSPPSQGFGTATGNEGSTDKGLAWMPQGQPWRG